MLQKNYNPERNAGKNCSTNSSTNSGTNSSTTTRDMTAYYYRQNILKQINALKAEKEKLQKEFDDYSQAASDISHAISFLDKLNSDFNTVKSDVRTDFKFGINKFSNDLDEQYENVAKTKAKLSSSVLPNIQGKKKTLSVQISDIDSKIKSLSNQL